MRKIEIRCRPLFSHSIQDIPQKFHNRWQAYDKLFLAFYLLLQPHQSAYSQWITLCRSCVWYWCRRFKFLPWWISKQFSGCLPSIFTAVVAPMMPTHWIAFFLCWSCLRSTIIKKSFFQGKLQRVFRLLIAYLRFIGHILWVSHLETNVTNETLEITILQMISYIIRTSVSDRRSRLSINPCRYEK